MIEYGMILTTGFLASMHCVGMCGAIVLACSARPASQDLRPRNNLSVQFLYNAGRIIAYTILGATIGFAGMTLSNFRLAGEIVSVAGGTVMVIGGAAMLGILPLPSTLSLFSAGGLAARIQSNLIRRQSRTGALGMGLLTPLLPCGILYAMLAKAASTGSALHGAMTMGIFAAGTVPALFALGALSSVLSSRIRTGAEKLAAISIILMGIVLILRGFHVPFLPAFLAGSHPGQAAGAACPNCLK